MSVMCMRCARSLTNCLTRLSASRDPGAPGSMQVHDSNSDPTEPVGSWRLGPYKYKYTIRIVYFAGYKLLTASFTYVGYNLPAVQLI